MNKGFTLIELLIAMAISAIVAGGIFTAYQSQQKSYTVQENVAVMQQNLRAGMDIMVREIRMAGYDPEGTNGAGIVSAGDGTSGSPLIFTFVADDDCIDNDGDSLDPDNCNDANVDEAGELKTIAYDLYDGYSDGDLDIGRAVGGGKHQPLAENIEALVLAYAFDADGDGNIDTYTDTSGVSQIIWAVDSDGDNRLDINLDKNGDGVIDASDDTNNDGKIDADDVVNNGGVDLDTPVTVSDIRAVRIWILARTGHMDSHYLNTHTYVVGNKIVTPNNNFRMRLSTSIVKCRNMGL